MGKICTSIEQSKKLLKLGIDVNTADMCYIQDLLAGCKYGDYKPHIGNIFPAYGQDRIPAWSLSALLGLMPIVNDNTYEMGGTLDGGALISHLGLTCVMFQEDNPLDAAFKLVVWLKENNKI